MARQSPISLYRTYNERTEYHPPQGEVVKSDITRESRTEYATSTYGRDPKKKAWMAYSFLRQVGSRDSSIQMREYFPDWPEAGRAFYEYGWLGASVKGPLLDDVVHDSDLILHASNRHMDEIKDMKVNLAQAFAERAQTALLIEQTAKRLATAFLNVKKGNLRAAAIALGVYTGAIERKRRYRPEGKRPKDDTQLSKDWLSLQYGWKPLLSDVKGAAESLARAHYSRPKRFLVKTTSSKTVQRSIPITFYSSYPVPGLNSGTETYICKYTSSYEVSNEFTRLGSQLGLADPALLAWELVPYSFVVDWFLPIGSFLSRLNYDSGLTLVARMRTDYSRFRGTVKPSSFHSQSVAGKTLIRVSDGQFYSSATRMDRVISPDLRPVLPSFQDPFSPVRALNAIALLRVAFNK